MNTIIRVVISVVAGTGIGMLLVLSPLGWADIIMGGSLIPSLSRESISALVVCGGGVGAVLGAAIGFKSDSIWWGH